jgi:hypothetical protein
VWQAAGHALFQIGTPEAHAALQGALEEADHFATFLAIKSIVATDPASAFSQFQSCLSTEGIEDDATRAVAREVLWFFGPATYSRDGPGWYLPEIPVLLREDSRWVESAIRLRRHPELGIRARHLLKTLTRDEVEAAVRRWPDPPSVPPQPYVGRRDFLARYEQGDHVTVWRELFAIGRLATGTAVRTQRIDQRRDSATANKRHDDVNPISRVNLSQHLIAHPRLTWGIRKQRRV